MYKVYFGQKALILAKPTDALIELSVETAITFIYERDGLNKPLETLSSIDYHTCIVLHHHPAFVFNELKEKYTVLQAGGGMVQATSGEVLLIYRKGKWDLPKGKLDKGENLEQCALREVEEETGLKGAQLGEKICITYHTYIEKGKPILKESHWYKMHVPQVQKLKPQAEEDIEACKWVMADELKTYVANMHPSVKDVLQKVLKA